MQLLGNYWPIQDPGPTNIIDWRASNGTSPPKSEGNVFKTKVAARRKSKAAVYVAVMNNDGIIDRYINLPEDKRTATEKGRGRESQHLDKATV